MRYDAIIDKYAVKCPNTTMLGYNKWKAEFGDIVIWNCTSEKNVISRVIGRVHYAPATPDSPEINDYILGATLSKDLTFVYERWINPIDVVQVYDPVRCGTDMVKRMAFFFGEAWRDIKPHDLRAWLYDGTPQLEVK